MLETEALGNNGKKRISRREFMARTSAVTAAIILPAHIRAWAEPETPGVSIVKVDTSLILNSFDPDQALGTSIDILPAGVVDKIYTPAMIKQCLSAGWGPITYRQNTELQCAAWHWNPDGTWSDPAHKSGYFTGSAELGEPIRHSHGYPLPHRGQTRHGGSEQGWSRLTDGNPKSYWKSNPYLTKHFSGEDDATHPQWIVIDLGAVESMHVIRVDWTNPFATDFIVQFWTGTDPIGPMDRPLSGIWQAFSGGTIKGGQGGSQTIQLSESLINARFLRIWMTRSSGKCSTHDPKDPRSSLGYAITEVFVGSFSSQGEFIDLVQHRPDENQTTTYCSSTDPWHSAEDISGRDDQTGFDLFFTSGITNHLPAMIPIAMVYATPEDSAAQLAYLQKRRYPISYVEMGEEPDGQYMLPEDYAALYLQWADALHKVDPTLKLGGPAFTGVSEDVRVWPDAYGKTSWLGRFLDYLKACGRISDFAFMSFERYPYEPCNMAWSDLYREPELIAHLMQVWRDDGLPPEVPLMITESNLSFDLAANMTDIFSALWLADSVGAFLAADGAAYYHSPIQPEPLRSGCKGWSTYGNFVAEEDLDIKGYTAQYYASRMINLEWVKHGAGVHKLYPVLCDLKDAAGHLLVTGYAAKCPDGDWSLLFINKDQSNPQTVKIEVSGLENFTVKTALSFGADQYEWIEQGRESHSIASVPVKLEAGDVNQITLPKSSITVVRLKS